MDGMMNKKYQPHTLEEQEDYQNGFDFAIFVVMNILSSHEDKALFSVHKFINEVKKEIEQEAKLIRNDW